MASMMSVHQNNRGRQRGVYVKLLDRRTGKSRQFTVRGVTPAQLEPVLKRAVEQAAVEAAHEMEVD